MIWKDSKDCSMSDDLRKWTFTHLTAHLHPYIFRNIKWVFIVDKTALGPSETQKWKWNQWKTWQTSGTDGAEGNPATNKLSLNNNINIMISVWNLWNIMKPHLVSCLDETERKRCFDFLFLTPHVEKTELFTWNDWGSDLFCIWMGTKSWSFCALTSFWSFKLLYLVVSLPSQTCCFSSVKCCVCCGECPLKADPPQDEDK